MLTFITMTAAFALTPGPAMIYTVNQTVAEGRSAGIRAALGIHIASYFHIALAATGVAFVTLQSPQLYLILKFAGCAYLVVLGLTTLVAPARKSSHVPSPTIKPSWFTNAFMVEVLNPKSALFFFSFLPQFIDLQGTIPVWIQILFFGTIANAAFSLAELLVLLLAERLQGLVVRSSILQDMTRRISGAVLIMLASHLALSSA